MKTKLYILPILLLFLTSCIKQGRGSFEEDGKRYYERWDGGNWRLKKVLIPADLETFEIVESRFGDSFSKDKNNVFDRAQIIEGADPKSFRFPNGKNGIHAIDKNRIYIHGVRPIPGSTSEGFKVLDERRVYIRDKFRVYWDSEALDICSIDNFKLVGKHWSTDGCHYFYNSYKIPSNDYDNIELFRLGIAKDSENIYLKDQRVLDLLRKRGIKIDTIYAESFEPYDLKYYWIYKDKLGCIDIHNGRIDCPDKSE